MKTRALTYALATLIGASMTTTAPAAYRNQNTEKSAPSLSFFKSVSLFKKVILDQGRSPTAKLPEVRPNFTNFLAPSETMKFIWFGHSTFLLNVDGHLILVDPVFHNASPLPFLVKRFQAPVVTLDELPSVETILISHDHYDHLDQKAIEYYVPRTNTRFIVPKGVGNHLRDWGIDDSRITELAWHESITSNDIKFTAAPAQHFSGRGLFDRNETLWASWIIQGNMDKIYYSGDSGYGPHFQEIGNKYGPFDYAFIENGQYNKLWPDVHMQPEESIQALIDLNAHTMIPVHWGMFDLSLHHWTEPIARTYAIARNWTVPLLTPRIGEIVDWNNRPSSAWWEPYLPAPESEPSHQELRMPEMATR